MRAIFVAAVLAPVALVAASQLRGNLATKLGWSAPGHEITAAIATTLLTSNTASQVGKILKPGETLESVSTWADQIKSDPAYKWSSALHFINTPDWQCAFTPTTDCAGDRCLYGAILNYTARSTDKTGEQQYEALKFLDHFLGDIHQPLHVAFQSNLGGNTIKGTFLGESGNLHHVWDYNILNERITRDFSGDQESFTTYLVDKIHGDWSKNATAWTSCVTPDDSRCIVEWASDSAALACNYAYKDENGKIIANNYNLGEGYYQRTIPIVEMQLVKGGLRLAGLLNRMWKAEEAAAQLA